MVLRIVVTSQCENEKGPGNLDTKQTLITNQKQRKSYAEIPERETPHDRQGAQVRSHHHHPHRLHLLHPELRALSEKKRVMFMI